MCTSPSFWGVKNLVISHLFTMSRTQDLEKSASKFLDDSVRDPNLGPLGVRHASAMRGEVVKTQFFREKNPMVNQNLCPIEMAILQYLGYVLLVQISDMPLLLHMSLTGPFSRCCNLWMVKPAHHGRSLSSSRSPCSRVSRERSKVPRTRRTTARLANFVASCCPKQP